MSASIVAEKSNGTLSITASGDWNIGVMAERTGKNVSASSVASPGNMAELELAVQAMVQAPAKASAKASEVQQISFHFTGTAWDSSLLAVFSRVAAMAAEKSIPVDMTDIPDTLARLVRLSLEVPPRGARTPRSTPGLLETMGSKIMSIPRVTVDILTFMGEAVSSLGRFLTGRAAFSRRDLWEVFRECGVDALPIVSLTSMLLGLILAFVSAIQLKMFGAEIYVAALVGVAMVRVMGPVLTGIVLAGRTGASFAAVIGSMQVNEEVDSLVTFGIKPMDFLVMPRLLGLAIMTPLLAIYADIMGIVGGFLVGTLMLDISPLVYWQNTFSNIKPSYVWIGLLHALVFGIVVALCGCYQGIRSGRNAEAVGRATTAAVVNSIVGIIVSTSIITVMFTMIDI